MDLAFDTLQAGIGDRYEIERELGRGGMATVYLARDVRHDRRVAVKVMRPDVSASLDAQRFLREVRVVAHLNHPHILPLHDSGRIAAPLAVSGDARATGELLYYVTPFIPAGSLRARLDREVALPIAQALRIASEVADALSFAHAQGVVHRDIKPENVLLAGDDSASSGDGHAVVADFGIARLVAETGTELTATGRSVGTPAYMSPEQASGERAVDARTDVYSLGCLLYEMLVGEPPFTGPNASIVIARHLTAPPPSIRAVRPNVPADLEALVHRALQKVPADRFATAAAFKAVLDRIRARYDSTGEASSTAGPSAATTGRAAARRWAIIATTLAVAASGVAIAWERLARDRVRSPRAAPAAPTLDRTRVAVVPLRAAGGADDAYLADASTDDLISALGRVGGLRVLARSTVPSPDPTGRTVIDVVRSVGAASFVEGTFHPRGDSVRFDVALVDATSGDRVWTGRYERRSHEMAGVQDAVAAAVARALGVADAGDRATRRRPVNGDAYDAYLRGVYLMSRSPVPSRAVADSATRLFEHALSIDSGFALAHAWIARVANILYFNIDPDPAREERAFIEIEKALALDPNLAEAYQEKGNLTWTRARGFPHEAAAKLHRRAIALNPSLVEPHHSLGSIYMHVGLLDRALAEYDTAVALDPATTFVPGRIARIHWYQGKYEQALREFEAIANRPNSFVAERALVLNYLGRSADALALLDSALVARRVPQPYDLHAARAVVLATRGNRDAARRAIGEALAGNTTSSHFHHAEYSLAQAFALLGDSDAALEHLRRTAAYGMPCYPLFRDDPHLRSLASDRRFVRFMNEMRQQFDRLAKTIE